jgi:hypothetical protein
MSPVITRPDKSWQGCFDCGEPVIVALGGHRRAGPSGTAAVGSERDRLERRLARLRTALTDMEAGERDRRAAVGDSYSEPESLTLMRADIARAEQQLGEVEPAETQSWSSPPSYWRAHAAR